MSFKQVSSAKLPFHPRPAQLKSTSPGSTPVLAEEIQDINFRSWLPVLSTLNIFENVYPYPWFEINDPVSPVTIFSSHSGSLRPQSQLPGQRLAGCAPLQSACGYAAPGLQPLVRFCQVRMGDPRIVDEEWGWWWWLLSSIVSYYC